MENFRRIIAITVALTMILAIAGCEKQEAKKDNNVKETAADESIDETFETTETETVSSVVPSDITGVDAIDALGSDFAGRINQTLGIPASDVKEYDLSEVYNPTSDEGMYYVCSNSSAQVFDCIVFDDEADAHAYFEDIYSRFNKGFNEDKFEGEYEAVYEENYGYIVMDGINPGTNIFGDINAVDNEFYCGIYYSGNVFIRVVMTPGVDCDDVEAMLQDLGLPMADGSNA